MIMYSVIPMIPVSHVLLKIQSNNALLLVDPICMIVLLFATEIKNVEGKV